MRGAALRRRTGVQGACAVATLVANASPNPELAVNRVDATFRTWSLTAALLLSVACSADDDAGDGAAEDTAAEDAATDVAPGDVGAELDASDADEEGGDAEPVLGPNDCRWAGTEFATARCLEPTRDPQYYVDEALRYFDTLDIDADPTSIPDYSELVARWEWPPWLLLTGFGRQDMIDISNGLRAIDPSTVPVRDCRFFEEQPFARCFVEFEYEDGPCPIYEEFVFDAEGRMSFIEAWSDLPEYLPQSDEDRWADAADYPRLSTRVPGLGSSTGVLLFEGETVEAFVAADAELLDLQARTEDFWPTWRDALLDAPDDFFARGCGWGSEE